MATMAAFQPFGQDPAVKTFKVKEVGLANEKDICFPCIIFFPAHFV